ncbi:IgA peptidase M64-domain-containing protein [Lactarius pseudohatsudake]|nr:IgA peptidase M64-domain-containing protein [Lactarius pseudohatsudake]
MLSLASLLCLFLFLPLVISDARPHELTIHKDILTGHCTIVRARRIPRHRRLSGEHHAFGFSRILFAGDRDRAVEQVTVSATNTTSLQDHFSQVCPDFDKTLAEVLPTTATGASQQDAFTLSGNGSEDLSQEGAIPLEVTEITVSGPSSNRVDVTFFSDGYCASERDKFISDVTRLVKEISANQTFHSVAPLLNFWAAFTPSEESGVGVDMSSTPFGLYRDGTELRGLYYAKPEVARDACNSLGDRCDYAVLVGNDPLYGGIGGEFVTVTPSTVNGALVLRHELGHSIIGVGEEYDGGFAYFGPNSAHDAQRLPWAHWLSTVPNGSSSPRTRRIERSIMPFQAYPWTILNATAPWRSVFHSSGTYTRHLVRFSLSGLPAAHQLSVRLDGKDLPWAPLPGISIDRWHYDIHRPDALSNGQHEVVFELLDPEQEGTAQLCSVEILEYGTEDEFDARPGVYGVFPTFSMDNKTTYRPTNEDCLMRLTVSPHFCSACAEALWLTLLEHIDLFEESGLDVYCSQSHTIIRTNLVQFSGEEQEHPYKTQWWFDGNILDDYTNHTELVLTGDAHGEVAVHVRLNIPEVQVDPEKLLSSERRVWLLGMCK